MYRNKTIDEYLRDVAARKPAPGGGSVAALTGALGAGLLSMVAHYTIGKDKYKEVEEVAKKALIEAESLRETLTKLLDEDVTVYKKYSEVVKTGRSPLRNMQMRL